MKNSCLISNKMGRYRQQYPKCSDWCWTNFQMQVALWSSCWSIHCLLQLCCSQMFLDLFLTLNKNFLVSKENVSKFIYVIRCFISAAKIRFLFQFKFVWIYRSRASQSLNFTRIAPFFILCVISIFDFFYICWC